MKRNPNMKAIIGYVIVNKKTKKVEVDRSGIASIYPKKEQAEKWIDDDYIVCNVTAYYFLSRI